MAARRRRFRMEADIRIHAEGELLRPPDAEGQLGAKEDRMVREEIVEAVRKGEPIVAIFRPQHQVVHLRHDVEQAGSEIETPEIERAKFVVVKLLPLDRERAEKRAGKPWRISNAQSRREQDVAHFSRAGQGHVRRVIERGRDRDGERFVTLNLFQDLLFANVRIVRARHRPPVFHAVFLRIRVCLCRWRA
jgi:hypothetical protein